MFVVRDYVSMYVWGGGGGHIFLNNPLLPKVPYSALLRPTFSHYLWETWVSTREAPQCLQFLRALGRASINMLGQARGARGAV